MKKGNFVSILSYGDKNPKISKNVFLADGVRIIGDVELGENVSVWFNAVIRGDVNSIKVGEGSNIQDLAVVHCTFNKYSTEIGSFVTVAHKAMVHGCKIGDHCMIGMNSVIMDGAEIGEGSIIAAGAVVKERSIIPPGSLVAGIPGKIIKQVSREQIEVFDATAKRYMKYTEGYNF